MRRARIAAADADALTAEVALHGMRLPLGALLIVRAFELWTHDDDIRRVAGLPPTVPDPPTLRLMTELAAGLLPHAVARMGQREPVSVHLVLTGPTVAGRDRFSIRATACCGW